jgi:hypothetical protein
MVTSGSSGGDIETKEVYHWQERVSQTILLPAVFMLPPIAGQVLSPLIGFRNSLDDRIPFAQQGKHVAAQEQSLGQGAQQRQRRGDAEIVSHFGCEGGQSPEPMIGLHRAEDAPNHCDLKVGRSFKHGRLAGEVLPNMEMFSPPGHLLAEPHQAGSDATGRDCLLSAMHVREQVNLDATGEIEASFNRRVDDRDFFDSNHCGSTFRRRATFMQEQAERGEDAFLFDKKSVFMTFVLFPR